MSQLQPSPLPTVLVVDQDADQRRQASDCARKAGFLVLESATALGALTLMQDHPEIGVIFADIPASGGLDALALVRTVETGWPPVRFLLVSGQRHVPAEDRPANSRFIPRPYEDAEIIGALQALEKERRGTLH